MNESHASCCSPPSLCMPGTYTLVMLAFLCKLVYNIFSTSSITFGLLTTTPSGRDASPCKLHIVFSHAASAIVEHLSPRAHSSRHVGNHSLLRCTQHAHTSYAFLLPAAIMYAYVHGAHRGFLYMTCQQPGYNTAAVNLDLDMLRGEDLKAKLDSLQTGLAGQHICLLGEGNDDLR
jgi:hypothetical protein